MVPKAPWKAAPGGSCGGRHGGGRVSTLRRHMARQPHDQWSTILMVHVKCTCAHLSYRPAGGRRWGAGWGGAGRGWAWGVGGGWRGWRGRRPATQVTEAAARSGYCRVCCSEGGMPREQYIAVRCIYSRPWRRTRGGWCGWERRRGGRKWRRRGARPVGRAAAGCSRRVRGVRVCVRVSVPVSRGEAAPTRVHKPARLLRACVLGTMYTATAAAGGPPLGSPHAAGGDGECPDAGEKVDRQPGRLQVVEIDGLVHARLEAVAAGTRGVAGVEHMRLKGPVRAVGSDAADVDLQAGAPGPGWGWQRAWGGSRRPMRAPPPAAPAGRRLQVAAATAAA